MADNLLVSTGGKGSTIHCDKITTALCSLHRLANEQSHWPPDFLFGHAHENGNFAHRGDYAHEVHPVSGIYGAHGGYETAEVQDVRGIGGAHGLRGVSAQGVDGVSPGPQSFQYQRRTLNDHSRPGRGGMPHGGRSEGWTFNAKMDRSRK